MRAHFLLIPPRVARDDHALGRKVDPFPSRLQRESPHKPTSPLPRQNSFDLRFEPLAVARAYMLFEQREQFALLAADMALQKIAHVKQDLGQLPALSKPGGGRAQLLVVAQ